MLARYYEASLGRFLSVDPVLKGATSLANPQRWNRYTYALNNPIAFVDPDGRDVVYADKLARQYVDSARKISPGTEKLLKSLAADHSKLVTFRTGDAADPSGPGNKIRLAETRSDYPPTGDVKYKATVTIDHDDISRTGTSRKTVVIHEVVGHVGPDSQLTREQADNAPSDEEREAEAQMLTEQELQSIPKNNRPARIPGTMVAGGGTPGQSPKVLVNGVDMSDPFTGR